MTDVRIRTYERKDLPLEQRLPSLARRFPSLRGARGIDPWNADALRQWMNGCSDEGALQTARLLLAIAGVATPAEAFDLMKAMKAWSTADRQMFVNFLRVWDF